MPHEVLHDIVSTTSGSESTALQRLADQLRHIRGISSPIHKFVVYLGIEDNATTVEPILALFAITIMAVFIFIFISMALDKRNKANARFATLVEVFRQYTIPSIGSYYLFAFVFSLFIVVWIDTFLRLQLNIYLYVIGTIAGLFLIRSFRKSYTNTRKAAQPYPLGTYKGINLYLTGGHRFSIIRGSIKDQRQSHLVAIGKTGAGKTTKIFIPGLLEDATNNCSAIVVEVKASAQEDMFSLIAPSWAAAGKKIMLFDPWGEAPDSEIAGNLNEANVLGEVPAADNKPNKASKGYHGLSFNPLLGLKPSFTDPITRDTIEELVDAIYRTYETERGSPTGNAAYYADQELGLIKGLLTISLFKPEGERNLAAIAEVFNGTLDDVIGYIESTMKMSSTPEEVVRDIGRSLKWFTHPDNLTDTMRAGTLRGVAGKLAIFTHPRVKPFLINDHLDLDLVFKEPTLLCIKSPLNAPGASTMASIIIRLLMSRVPNKLSYGAGKDFKVFFYLDELPTLSLPKFDHFCKTARSSGTGIIASIHDRSDMADIIKAKLGINSIDGLLGNFKTQYLLPGLQLGTCSHYSESFGKLEVKVKNVNRTTGMSARTSRGYSYEEKLLMQPDQIKHLPDDECIIVDSNHRPFIAKTTPWYKSNKYKDMIKKNKKVKIEITCKSNQIIEYKPPTLGNYDLSSLPKDKKTKQPENTLPRVAVPGATVNDGTPVATAASAVVQTSSVEPPVSEPPAESELHLEIRPLSNVSKSTAEAVKEVLEAIEKKTIRHTDNDDNLSRNLPTL